MATISWAHDLWDGDQIVQKRLSGNTSANISAEYYTYGFQAFTNSTLTGNYFYAKDHLGSIREVVAGDGQTVEGRYNYGPWGETTYLDYSNGTVTPDFGYAGYFQTPYAPNLYFTEYRVYGPDLRRWLSRDPIGMDGGVNLYGFVDDDPISQTDPLGLWTFAIGGTIDIQIWRFNFYYSGGFVADGCHNFGIYRVIGGGGGGPGKGLRGNAGFSVSGSNGQTINDLSGPFGNVNAGLGDGGSVGGDFYEGRGSCGQRVLGGGLTAGAGIGGGYSIGPSDTRITTIF